jgi:beta-1,2-mannobiose phosphorylase / 1,2-beta-oligomannan phosphorylase
VITLTRIPENPILFPHANHDWEHDGAFNGCVVFAQGEYHMVYRALSAKKQHNGVNMQVSSVGYAKSNDGIHFTDHRPIIFPSEEWDMYGCEDPRITYMDGKFYIFYTALSEYPFRASGIKLGFAVTEDFTIFKKNPVTTFNSKAMALFPEKINNKLTAVLTINTDMPPARISIAQFDKEEDISSPIFWTHWYDNANDHILNLLRDGRDQVELGAAPIKTDRGWLVIYSYIKNYMSNNKEFGIEVVLLDLERPQKIIARTKESLLVPQEKYELEGNVVDVIFPSGAVVKDKELLVYYGAADTTCALATCNLEELLNDLKPLESAQASIPTQSTGGKFTRYDGNPIIKPVFELDWQKEAAFNPTVIYEDNKVHIVYRAQGKDGTSVLGYAMSKNGIHIDEALSSPIYVPRESFEKKIKPQGNSGCEDPRITKINDRLYMTYTAFDGVNPPRIALTSIALSDFLNKNWQWEKPKLISPPGVDDKDGCIVKNIKGDGYIAFHRLGDVIWLDHLRDLDFPEKKFLSGGIIAQARKDKWDNVKIGISGPPIETDHGWILMYHGVSNPGFVYKIGAMLLDYDDPRKILARTQNPIFEPEKDYELKGRVPNVVFPCGTVTIDRLIYMYYGGADTVIGVATMPLKDLTELLLSQRI